MCANITEFKDIKYAVLTCKKYDPDDKSERGKGGAVVALTGKCLVIGKYDSTVD